MRPGPWFRSALARFEAALGGPLDFGQESVVTEWPADTLGCAQARERFGIRGRDEVGKIRKAFANGRAGRDPVILARKMRARARPAPVLRAGDQTSAHRIERHVAQCGREMILVHGNGTETALPEMPGPPASRMNDASIAAAARGPPPAPRRSLPT